MALEAQFGEGGGFLNSSYYQVCLAPHSLLGIGIGSGVFSLLALLLALVCTLNPDVGEFGGEGASVGVLLY